MQLLLPLPPTHPQYLKEQKQKAEAKVDAHYRKGSSRHRGVSKWTQACKTKPWVMSILLPDKLQRESYATEGEAARAYDRHAIRRDGR